jgi:hypothetical protein
VPGGVKTKEAGRRETWDKQSHRVTELQTGVTEAPRPGVGDGAGPGGIVSDGPPQQAAR